MRQGRGAPLTFSDHANELEVRAVDGLKACDGLVDNLHHQVEQHHRRFLTALLKHAVLVPEPGLGVECGRSALPTPVGHVEVGSRALQG